MRLLLDTHTFIWYTTDSSRLSSTARSLIDNGDNDILISTASIWEMAMMLFLMLMRSPGFGEY
jgi:PIN domain nuclease of toxin-antitoxin system